ncbi:MAG: single-stranded DNA-binding protein [Solobacterium sp.]|nr:single-stranded DNA-binding protein [Solobacterium sp.]
MLNKVLIQGRLTKEPELKQTQSGISKLIFTVAWSEKYKEVETKCFLLCEAWRQTAEFISNYFRKGQEINLEGHMVTEDWNGEQVTFCTIDKAHFCGSKSDNAPKQGGQPKPEPDDFMSLPEGAEEELPFH